VRIRCFGQYGPVATNAISESGDFHGLPFSGG
jgi:hypothetical protein